MHYSAVMPTPSQVLGRRLRRLRTARGWSQKVLCERAGLSPRFLVQLERGQANPSLQRLLELAGALEMPLSELVADLTSPAKVALIGMRGAGKSTIGARLASHLGCPFLSLDEVIEAQAGMRLGDLFEFQGPEGYRAFAKAAVDSVLGQHGPAVLEVGGSLVMEESAYSALRTGCEVVWLKASPEVHLERVRQQGDLRPMAGWANPLAELQAILKRREPLYGLAHRQIDTEDLGVQGSVREIARAVE